MATGPARGTAPVGAAGAVAAAVVAGGAAQRMGGAIKPLLLVDGVRILDRQLEVLQPLFPRVALVVADARAQAEFQALGIVGRPGVEVIHDRPGPGLGPLAGIDAALAWLPPEFGAVVCVGGDMPHLSSALLAHLRDAAPGAAAVVPRWSRGLEPLCARYARMLGHRTAAALATDARAVHRFVEHLSTTDPVTFVEEPVLRALDPDLRSFANVNTPADLVAWRDT